MGRKDTKLALKRTDHVEDLPPGHQRATWATPVGEFTVDLVHRPGPGTALVAGPAEVTAPISGRGVLHFRRIRRGIPLTVDGRSAMLTRPRYGLRAGSREIEIVVEDGPSYRIRARTSRIELTRDGTLVAVSNATNPSELPSDELTWVTPEADAQDTALVVALTALELWGSAALWSQL